MTQVVVVVAAAAVGVKAAAKDNFISITYRSFKGLPIQPPVFPQGHCPFEVHDLYCQMSF